MVRHERESCTGNLSRQESSEDGITIIAFLGILSVYHVASQCPNSCQILGQHIIPS